MSTSAKKNKKVVDRRTKAQLLQELSEAQNAIRKQEIELIASGREIQNTKLELKKLKEKKKPSQPAKANSTEENKLLSENKKLKNQLQKLEDSSATQIETANQQLRKTEQENKDLKQQVLDYEEKLKSVKKNATMKEDQDEIIVKEIATSVSTFLIHFYSQQEYTQGKIEHISSGDKKVISLQDSKIAFEFISKHLPKIAEEEKEIDAAHAEVLKGLKLLQLRRFQDAERPLQANRPFALFTHLQFPVMPTASNMDMDTSTYQVSVLMTDAKRKTVVARSGAANALLPKIANYENRINMPGVAPGKYWLKICTFAPFANVEEDKEIQLNFQP